MQSVESELDGTVEMDRARLMAQMSEDVETAERVKRSAPVQSGNGASVSEVGFGEASDTEKMPAIREVTKGYDALEHQPHEDVDEDTARFKTLDIPLEAVEGVFDHERVARTEPLAEVSEPTTQQFRKQIVARVEFQAEVDEEGKIQIPARFFRHALVEPGMKVRVTIAEDHD